MKRPIPSTLRSEADSGCGDSSLSNSTQLRRLVQTSVDPPGIETTLSQQSITMPCDDWPHRGFLGTCHGIRHPCVDPMHGAGPYTICTTCITATHAQGWVVANVARFTARSPPFAWYPPPPPALLPQPPWPGFWTRLCRECEKREQELNLARQHGVEPPAFTPAAHLAHLAVSGHLNTCTCRDNLIGMHSRNRRCRPCHQAWTHNILARKDRNDKWLRGTDVRKDAKGWITTRADAKTRMRRCAEGSWRACRCGASVNTGRLPEVLMCMACEGLRHVRNPGLLPGTPGGSWFDLKQFNPKRHDREFKLRRLRSSKVARNASSVNE